MVEITFRREEQFLCPEAFRTADTKGRMRPIRPDPVRTDFQRDRDRITHSKSFRRLMHKMQVFLAPEGDHYRTRLTHTLEVAQIGRTLARALCLNEDLVEAAALGHDIGHTPFGHSGERALNGLCQGLGGFKHYEQSLRVVDKLEREGEGLNLTYEVRDAILKHTNQTAETLEGQLVKLADHIAYINHDIDDARRAGILTDEDIPDHIAEILGRSHGERIEALVLASIRNGVKNGIGVEEPYGSAMRELHAFMFDRVYTSPIAKSEDHKVTGVIEFLFEHFAAHPDEIAPEYRKVIEEDGIQRAVADYIAGMTDRYAIGCFESLFVPKVWSYK